MSDKYSSAETRPRVLVTASLEPDQLATLYSIAEVDYRPDLVLEAGSVAELDPFELWLLPPGQHVPAALLDRLPKLRFCSTPAAGFDHVDVVAAARCGVRVSHTPHVTDQAVAEVVFGLLLCLGRGLVGNDRFVRSGRWPAGPPPLAPGLYGQTLGLLGMGRIGSRIARIAQVFGMRVIYHNRSPLAPTDRAESVQWRPRRRLFGEADYVVVTVPLTPETRSSITAVEFDLMRPTAYFVNVARGEVVDEAALAAVLRERRIAGAAIDVFQGEPIGEDHPLCGLDNVVLSPHIGSATELTRRAMSDLAVFNVLQELRGENVPTTVPVGEKR